MKVLLITLQSMSTLVGSRVLKVPACRSPVKTVRLSETDGGREVSI